MFEKLKEELWPDLDERVEAQIDKQIKEMPEWQQMLMRLDDDEEEYGDENGSELQSQTESGDDMTPKSLAHSGPKPLF